MKIIAVGWNYRGHNAEMNQKETPQNPIIFFKPETALLKDGKPFFLPQFSDRIEYETELVFHISRLGKNIASKFAHRYYDIPEADILASCGEQALELGTSKPKQGRTEIRGTLQKDSTTRLPSENSFHYPNKHPKPTI